MFAYAHACSFIGSEEVMKISPPISFAKIGMFSLSFAWVHHFNSFIELTSETVTEFQKLDADSPVFAYVQSTNSLLVVLPVKNRKNYLIEIWNRCRRIVLLFPARLWLVEYFLLYSSALFFLPHLHFSFHRGFQVHTNMVSPYPALSHIALYT